MVGTMARRCAGPASLLLLLLAAIGAGPASAPAAAPSRIVTLAPNAAEMICALGAESAVVGVSRFCLYPESLRDRPRVGGLFDPNLERIISLRPDLLVLRGRSEALEQMCHDRGIAVYYDQTERLRDVPKNLRALGKLLGRPDQAEALARDFDAQVSTLQARYADVPPVRVLVTISRRPAELANLLTTGKGTFLDEALTAVGGRNIFGHVDAPYPQVALEDIVARRPEVIIELMPEAELDAEGRQRCVTQWQQLPTLPAVRAGRVHVVTTDHALIPSLRFPQVMAELGRLLHPEVPAESPPTAPAATPADDAPPPSPAEQVQHVGTTGR